MQSQLVELCGQFEQVFLASLLPQSVISGGVILANESPDDATHDFGVESGTMAALFTQAFAAALERAGGVGLARELYRSLSERRA